MIVAVDTCVLLDILVAGAPHASVSKAALMDALSRGSVIASEVVYAELAAAFKGDGKRLKAFLNDADIQLVPSREETLVDAGRMWRRYRNSGGTRERIISDFLVGAHAKHQAGQLLTRDRGFYRTQFEGVDVVDPTGRAH